MGFRFRLCGDYACFARPEFRLDRISYDVIPPRAARGILESLYWRPEMRWRIDAIHVLNPIVFEDHGLDPPASSGRRGRPEQRLPRTRLLRAVDYIIEAHFDLREPDGNAAQHTKMILTRARQGRFFREPFMGSHELPARLELIEKDAPLPESDVHKGERDLGWMMHDFDDEMPANLHFFRASLIDGKMTVPEPGSAVLAA
jgi:CRISPR-associated protein Cas5d